MKSLKFVILLFFTSLIVSGCGSSKGVQSGRTKLEENECRKLAMEKPSTRAWGRAVHPDMSHAISYAEADARNKFAAAIETAVKLGRTVYDEGYQKATADNHEGAVVRDDQGKRELENAQVAGAVVRNTVVIKDELYELRNGQIEAYVTLEYTGDIGDMTSAIVKNIKQRVSDEERQRIDYDEKKFREYIEEELKKMRAADK